MDADAERVAPLAAREQRIGFIMAREPRHGDGVMAVATAKGTGSAAIRRIRSVLGCSPHFCTLPAEKLDRLAALGRLVTYKSGDLVVGAWQPADKLLVLLRGGLRISLPNEDGTSFVVAVIGEGSFFSPASLVKGELHRADAYAIGRTNAAEFAMSEVRREFHGDQEIESHAKGRLLEVLAAVANVYRDAVVLPLAQALPRRLLSQALAAGQAWKDGGEIELHVLQGDLAEMLGKSRTSISAELKRLEHSGVVRLGYRKVVVRDMTGLCAAAGKGVVPL
jgi:CRP-like cAMP-binding protein